MNTSISSNPKDPEGKPHYHPGEVIQTRSLLLRGVDQNMSHTGSGDAEVTTVSAGGGGGSGGQTGGKWPPPTWSGKGAKRQA